MPRGVALSSLVTQLRAEVRRSTNVSVGVDDLDNVKQVLRRVQETLYDEHDWPFLRFLTTKTLSAGSRYYDLPDGLTSDQIEQVSFLWNGTWQPVSRGIGFDEYSIFDPDADERSDPVLRWDLRSTALNAEQIEVWPLPASNGNKLGFQGKRDLGPLIADSDISTLDDKLIVLYAAAELLAAQKAADANIKMAAALARLSTLKARAAGPAKRYVMGAGHDIDRAPVGRAVVRIGR
jgi:hypothetical protein